VGLHPLIIGCGSALLFLVQPMLAKAILPRFGGSAGVWVTSMLFFQVVLLAGYLYAYWVTRYLAPKGQAALHLALLLLSLSQLPLRVSFSGAVSRTGHPVAAILLLLTLSVGLPYFLLAANSPLQQSWYVGASSGGRFPYRLFALSNAASLGALLAYPVLIEPFFSQRQQLRCWSGGYVVFLVACGFSALRQGVLGKRAAGRGEEAAAVPSRPWLWVALGACASTLWLAVANYLSQEVAAIPFLWLLPLSLYLLSFILCFEGHGWYRPGVFRWLLPLAWGAVCYRMAWRGDGAPLALEILVFSAGLFVCAMFCHGELARSKPEPRHGLEFFYLMIALGGALGAVFVGLVAPNCFSTFLEVPVGIVASVLLALYLIYGYTAPRRLLRTAVIAALALVVTGRVRPGGQDVSHARNFYGVLQVSDTGTEENAVRSEYNGRTLHGVEYLAPDRSRLPAAFYGPESGAGLVLASTRIPHARVGIVGLGVGTLAAYGRPGDRFRFYDINPAVVEYARQYFRFLAESAAATDVVLDDGRLAIEREPLGSFDVIVLDAFADDSIPLHLLTEEAFESYFRRLQDGGILAIHITNRYLDLFPVVAALAGALHKEVVLVRNSSDPARHIETADWAIVSGNHDFLRELAPYNRPMPVGRKVRLWTDDYSNLFQVLR
jgi:SAM-dependent methyltransferase